MQKEFFEVYVPRMLSEHITPQFGEQFQDKAETSRKMDVTRDHYKLTTHQLQHNKQNRKDTEYLKSASFSTNKKT